MISISLFLFYNELQKDKSHSNTMFVCVYIWLCKQPKGVREEGAYMESLLREVSLYPHVWTLVRFIFYCTLSIYTGL